MTPTGNSNRPATGRSATDRPAADRPAADRPATDRPAANRAPARPADGVGRPLFRAGAVMGLAAAGFGAWLFLAPLSGAVIAEGRFKVDGDVKTVQHLDGGIVAEIAVRDGDRVRAGDLLMRLDATEAEASLAALAAERDSLIARRARLEAERDGRVAPMFSGAEFEGADRPGLAAAIANQSALFAARRAELTARDEVLTGTVLRLAARLDAQRAELHAVKSQRGLAEENAEAARSLAGNGRLTRNDLNARERDLFVLTGARDALEAGIAETEASQGEARLSHARAVTQHLSAVSTELSEVVAELAGIAPRLAAERMRIARARVSAPVDGIVVGLSLSTVGGVVGAGAPILEIVPEGGKLIAEARLAPEARERLRTGMAVELRLPGVRARKESGFSGVIELISAELTDDARSADAAPSYAMRIALADPPEGVRLEPGMPVTTVVPTDARTALDYLVSPLADAMARSMRER